MLDTPRSNDASYATGSSARSLIERYDRHADAYRELWAPILKAAGRTLVRELASPREATRCVLDVGTGVGSLLPDLRDAFPGAYVAGVDRSRGMLSLAPRGDVAVMDATRLAVASSSVDRVVMVFMLFHVEPAEDGLAEVMRVLRPGGRLGIVTWAGELESVASRVWAECLDAHGAAPVDPAAEARHDRLDTPAKMETLLRDAGFVEARAWSGELVATIDAEHLVGLRTRLGSSKPRYDSLSAEAQSECLAKARRLMERLAPEDFVSRGGVVYTVARAPRRATRPGGDRL